MIVIQLKFLVWSCKNCCLKKTIHSINNKKILELIKVIKLLFALINNKFQELNYNLMGEGRVVSQTNMTFIWAASHITYWNLNLIIIKVFLILNGFFLNILYFIK